MKTFSYDTGGSNTMFCWGYINYYGTGARGLFVHGSGSFTTSGRAVIDDFGNLVGVSL